MTRGFLFAAGGTGGHVLPALAVAECLGALLEGARIHFAGGRRGIEGRLVPAMGFPLSRFPAAGLRGLGWKGLLRFALAFPLALIASLLLILRLRPALVLATGGYACAAPALAGVLSGRPLWIQEQNSVPGSTNRLLARFAERIYVAFPEAGRRMGGGDRIHLLPNPVRRSIVETADRPGSSQDYREFGLELDRPTLLVFGGSRGAATIARAMREAWPDIRESTRWQAIIQVASDEFESTRAAIVSDGDASRARVLPFIEDMAAAYRIADLVVCRAGALTLAELSMVGRPAILVPFPHATDDHQRRNAGVFERKGAAVVVDDAGLDGRRLVDLLTTFDGDDSRMQEMAAAARQVDGGKDGARELAGEILLRTVREARS